MQVETDIRWVPVAVARDIPDGTVVPASMAGRSIAVWRSRSGRIHANADRCPHRGMRLSHGFVRGETLSCIYHGWRYGADGACEHIPAHPDVAPPSSINCGALPVREENGVVWAAPAAPTTEPPLFETQEALRSLRLSAAPEQIIAKGTPKGHGIAAMRLNETEATLLLAPISAAETVVIALVPRGLGTPEKRAASEALEALRRALETREVAA